MTTEITVDSTREMFITQTSERVFSVEINRRGCMVTTADQVIYNDITVEDALDLLLLGESLVSGVSKDTEIEEFFHPDRCYDVLIIENTGVDSIQISGGIAPGGFELFTGEYIRSGEKKPVRILLTPVMETSLYLHAGSDDDVWHESISVQTLSRRIL